MTIAISVELINTPPETAGGEWVMLAGPQSPWRQYAYLWHPSSRVPITDPIFFALNDGDKYFMVTLIVKGAQYSMYEVTTPTTFEDGARYIWDYSTNSLSRAAPAPPELAFLDKIFAFVWDLSDWFNGAYKTVSDWIWPFNLLAVPLLTISEICFDLLTPIAHFSDWARDVAEKIGQGITWDSIKALILGWLPGIEDLVVWFSDWLSSVVATIDSWWSSVSLTVQGWIDTAGQAIKDLIDQVETNLTALQEAWDDFKDMIPSLGEVLSWFSNWWEQILSPLTDWWNDKLKVVSALIDSTLKAWFPNYDDLVRLWNNTAEFITNPLDWLLDRFADWFLGPEV